MGTFQAAASAGRIRKSQGKDPVYRTSTIGARAANVTFASRPQTSGYLNLLANCIDNFTHGLAVAGSFLVSKKVRNCQSGFLPGSRVTMMKTVWYS